MKYGRWSRRGRYELAVSIAQRRCRPLRRSAASAVSDWVRRASSSRASSSGFSKTTDHETLEFVKEFELILFVFTIGLQPCSVALCLELSDRFLPPGVSTVEAIVGRPLTPVSVSGVARRTARRALRMSTTAESQAAAGCCEPPRVAATADFESTRISIACLHF